MSKYLVLATLGVAALVANTGSAAAYDPFDDDYEPPRYQRSVTPKRAAAARAAAARPAPRPVKSSWFDDDEDAFVAPAPAPRATPRAAAAAPSGGQLEGGNRPNISPVAPPTVAFAGTPGTITIDTRGRALYYSTSATTAYRYPISVGREGFTWTGTEKISRVQAWPDWRPPEEMKERQPNLPDVMAGGIRNPLGAKALYLGNSLYRIHGTNDVKSIGQAASSGCFRMMNGHVTHLATMAGVGTTVKVVHRLPSNVADGGRARRG